jgi:acetylornithine deacetylase/succinyl-diaminopimelate desuccinylase family protein
MSARPDAEALVATLGALIGISSTYPPGDSRAIARYLADRLKAAGYRVEALSRQPNVDNVVARLGAGRPQLVISTHVDTVGVGTPEAWASDPFVARMAQGKIFGLGAANAKGSIAAQLWLAEQIAKQGGPRTGELVFAFVGDEERLGPDGLAYLREIGVVTPDILIVGGPTANQLVVAERGVLWARVTTRGRTAHAGDPASGDSAILRMIRIIAAIERALGPNLAARRDGAMQATINIGRIAGGHNPNVVPDHCAIEIDRRLLPSESVEGAFEELRAAALGAGEPEGTVALERLSGTVGFKAGEDRVGLRAMRAAIEAESGRPAQFLNAMGVGDGRYFARDSIEIINFGPGDGAAGHAANEWLSIDELVAAAAILMRAIGELLGVEGR